ncbi:MAG: VWA domain-containing protein [Acidobacteria bacterium]|nr:VWA domain-containing protein [Acidobacteriota bacterium]
MRRWTFSLMMALFIALPCVAAAGSKKTPTPKPIGGFTFKNTTNVTLVNIDVFVTDKKGNPVTGLKKSDFEVFQDGIEKTITNFAVFNKKVYRALYSQKIPGLRTVTATPTPAPVTQPQVKPIYIVIYIDNMNLRPLDRNQVLRQIRGFVRENLVPPTQMMVAFFNHSLKILQPFTDDPEQIYHAMNSIKLFTGGRPERDAAHKDVVEMMRKYKDQDRAAMGSSYDQNRLGSAYHLLRAYADEGRNQLSFTIGGLREIVSMLAGLPGKKAVLYISDGLQMVPGLDLFYEYSSVYHNTDIMNLITDYDRTGLFKNLVSNAAAQGVTFYTVGAQGLRVSGSGTAESRYAQHALSSSVLTESFNDSLRYMAEGTGGRAIVNTNDFRAGFEKISNDLYTYYSIGYMITSSGRDKIHKIKVKLKNNRGYTVRYRRHFIEKSLESRVQDQVMTSLVFPVDHNPMHVQVITGRPSPATNEWWSVPIHVSFPLKEVTLLPDKNDYVGRVVLYVAARDASGKRSDIQRQEHEIRIPAADYKQAQTKRFGIDVSLLMATGHYTVAVGILDEISQQDSLTTIHTLVNPGAR